MPTSTRRAVWAFASLICLPVVAWPGAARAQAPTKTIYSFPFTGDRSSSDLTADRSGNLYGVMPGGGPSRMCDFATSGCGTVYRLIPPASKGQPWTEETLYTFGNAGSGYNPLGKPLLGADGSLYGTTHDGGLTAGRHGSRHGTGTVWKLSPPAVAGDAWTFTVLYTFSHATVGTYAGPNGGNPAAGLVMDRSGTLYGTASQGGPLGNNDGVVFSLAPPAAGSTTWTETVLHSFGASKNGTTPYDPLTLSADQATLSGVTELSINANGSTGGGVVYRLRRQSGGWTYALLYRFARTQAAAPGGFRPVGGLLLDRNNNMFGATLQGGPSGDGLIFELSPPSAGQTLWTEQVLHSFSGPDGKWPNGSLVAGGMPTALFGTAALGGAVHDSNGVVFRLDPPVSGSGAWTYTQLHTFTYTNGKYHGDTDFPTGGLTFGLNRFLFGVTGSGGRNGDGGVFAQSQRLP